MKASAVEIRGLCKRYDRFTLGPVDLTVPRGSIYGLIGPNGAGKTTLLDLVFGMGQPSGGTIRVLGLDHQTSEVEMKQRAAYVGPDLMYTAWSRVQGVLNFVRGFHPTWDEELAGRLLQRFRLTGEDRVGSLSFGARMKLALVLALAWRPEVLVLDEPTTGLDAEARRELFGELLRLVQNDERTVLISSHQISDLERFADHVAILHRGAVISEGSMGELTDRWRLVDFTKPDGVRLEPGAGFRLLKANGLRGRALVDGSLHTRRDLEALGLRDLGETQLPLEEVFLALTSEQ